MLVLMPLLQLLGCVVFTASAAFAVIMKMLVHPVVGTYYLSFTLTGFVFVASLIGKVRQGIYRIYMGYAASTPSAASTPAAVLVAGNNVLCIHLQPGRAVGYSMQSLPAQHVALYPVTLALQHTTCHA
jgi:hypothetical protein